MNAKYKWAPVRLGNRLCNQIYGLLTHFPLAVLVAMTVCCLFPRMLSMASAWWRNILVAPRVERALWTAGQNCPQREGNA